MKRLILGLMSGTSLDGLDLCLAEFDQDGYSILKAETRTYEPNWKQRLSDADTLTGLELTRLDRQYGQYLGNSAISFLEKNGLPCPDCIASHGHTVFHQPKDGFTLQIGSGAALAAESGLPVVCDFRSLDVALGGQGAPLVPIGDLRLFKDYQACLNLGGFANISIKQADGSMVAYDICPCNIVLNHLVQNLGQEYDAGGQLAASGKVHPTLLKRLDKLSFYHEIGPKSLGREWVADMVLPLLVDMDASVPDKLRTFAQHIANQIGGVVKTGMVQKVLATGGGAHNTFLMELIIHQCAQWDCQVIIPDRNTVDFKEALIFAYLGYLYLGGQPNSLATVTGAIRDNIGGCLYNPPNRQ